MDKTQDTYAYFFLMLKENEIPRSFSFIVTHVFLKYINFFRMLTIKSVTQLNNIFQRKDKPN